LPIPTLHIDDEALAQPRQPVPLRHACLVTGLTCAEFRYLLAAIHGGEPCLTAYEYRRPPESPRQVPPNHYRNLLRDPPAEPPSAAFLKTLPTHDLSDPARKSTLARGAFSLGQRICQIIRGLSLNIALLDWQPTTPHHHPSDEDAHASNFAQSVPHAVSACRHARSVHRVCNLARERCQEDMPAVRPSP
jgi:hypothetical protein